MGYRYVEPRASWPQEPFADDFDAGFDIVPVGLNILSCDVGYKLLIPVLLGVENQADFFLLQTGTILLGTQEEPQFQWHIKAGQVVLVKFHLPIIGNSLL